MGQSESVLRDWMGNFSFKANLSALPGSKSKVWSPGHEPVEVVRPPRYTLSDAAQGSSVHGKSFSSFEEAVEFASQHGYQIGNQYKNGYGLQEADLEHTATKAEHDKEQAEFSEKWKDAKQVFVRFGSLPKGGQSKNARDQRTEQGVSVFRGLSVGREVLVVAEQNDELGSMMSLLHRPCYIVSGDETGTGSDGEPILKNAKVLKKVNAAGFTRGIPRK